MGWGRLLVLGSALVSSGCSADDGAGRKANGRLEEGHGDSALICKGAGWKAPRAVAAGFLGNDLLLLRADGTQQNAHSFQMPANAVEEYVSRGIRTDAGAFTATVGAMEALGSPLAGETVRVRNDGRVVWRLNGIAQVASDAGMGALVNGVPKLVRADGTTSDVPVPGFDTFEFLGNPDADGWMAARWTRFEQPNEGGQIDYTGRVNLDGVRHEEALVTPGPSPRLETAEWALEDEGYVPAWLVHRPTNTRTPVRLDRLAPLRPLGGMHCNRATLLEDGRIGLGIRDESTAGFYVGNADGTGWERIGEPLRDVTGIEAYHVGASWVVTASSGNNTYCPPVEPFAESGATAIAGDSLQLVAPGLEPFVFLSDQQWTLGQVSLDSTGTCAFRRSSELVPQTMFIDLSTGASAGAPAFESFTWL